jgi:hypothetical protein
MISIQATLESPVAPQQIVDGGLNFSTIVNRMDLNRVDVASEFSGAHAINSLAALAQAHAEPQAAHEIRPCRPQAVKKLTAAYARPKQKRRIALVPNFPSNLRSSSRQALCRPNMSRKAGRIKG